MPEIYGKSYYERIRSSLNDSYNDIKPDWAEIVDYFYPRGARFISKNVNKTIKRRNTKIIDSTPIIALRNFSSGMMSGATNPATSWFRIGVLNYDIQSDYEVKSWCSIVEKLLKKVINVSKIYTNLPIIYKMLGSVGIGGVALQSDYETVFHSKVLPIGSFKIGRNAKGEVDTLAREFTESAKNLFEEFGEENCPDSVKESAKTNPQSKFEIVHLVTPNPEHNPRKIWAKNKKFVSVYYLLDGGNEDKLLRKSGFSKFPYIIFDAEICGEDDYPSDFPGINALPDVKQLMSLTKDYAKAVKKIVSPAYRGPASLKNLKIADTPSAFTPEDENGRGLAPVYEVNPQVLQLKAEKDDTKQIIKEHFYNDLFAVILSTAERTRTAFEVNELKEEKMVLLSPLLEQIHLALKNLIEWIFNELCEVGLIPPPPEQIQGGEIEIQFISTLAQAQRAQNIGAMERFTTFVINLSNALDPTLKDKIIGENVVDDYADYANIDPKQVRPNEELNKIRAARAQEAQAHQQAAAIAQGSEVIKNLGGADAFGSELLQRVGL